MRNALLALLVAGLVLPAAAGAQNASSPSSTELQVEVKRKRHLVRPVPSPAVVAEDVERARGQLEERVRDERLLRQQSVPASRRPDLDYDVVSGIQGRTLQKALRR